jgi:hypothetical protein
MNLKVIIFGAGVALSLWADRCLVGQCASSGLSLGAWTGDRHLRRRLLLVHGAAVRQA